MSANRTPAEELRRFVVRAVVLALIGLAFGLYALVGYLLVRSGVDAVPDALWLAAGGATGTLAALLVNSKSESNTATVDVTAPAELAPAGEEYVDP